MFKFIFHDGCECKMRKSEIIGILAIAVFSTIIFGSIIGWLICELNAPPQGAPYCSIDIKDPKAFYLKGAGENFTLQVSGNLSYDTIISYDHFDPLPVRAIIDVQTNEFLEVNRESISSRNFSLQMEFNETVSFVENLSVPAGTYIVNIEIFALKPNKWWGTTWAESDRKYLNPITIS